MQLNFDKLVYLDVDFVSRKFEELTGLDPDSKITKTEGANAGLKVVFANAGVTTQEARTYAITSRSMLGQLWEKLQNDFPEFQSFRNYQGTKLLWVSGQLTVAEWKEKESAEPGYEFFQLNHSGERMAFLAEDSYFAAGFGKVLRASSALKGNIGIPVRCLARVMWHVDDAKNYVACPYVVVEES